MVAGNATTMSLEAASHMREMMLETRSEQVAGPSGFRIHSQRSGVALPAPFPVWPVDLSAVRLGQNFLGFDFLESEHVSLGTATAPPFIGLRWFLGRDKISSGIQPYGGTIVAV